MNITHELVDQTLLRTLLALQSRPHATDMTVLERAWHRTRLRHTDLYPSVRRLEQTGDLQIERVEQDRLMQLTPKGRDRAIAFTISQRLSARFQLLMLREKRRWNRSNPETRRRRTDLHHTGFGSAIGA